MTQSLRLPPARESPALSDGSPRVAYFHTQHTRGERGDGTRLAASGALVTNARGAAAMHASLVSEGEAYVHVPRPYLPTARHSAHLCFCATVTTSASA